MSWKYVWLIFIVNSLPHLNAMHGSSKGKAGSPQAINARSELLMEELTALKETFSLTASQTIVAIVDKSNDFLEDRAPAEGSFEFVIDWSTKQQIARLLPEIKKAQEELAHLEEELNATEGKMLDYPKNMLEAHARSECLSQIDKANQNLVEKTFLLSCCYKVRRVVQLSHIKEVADQKVAAAANKIAK